MESRHYWEETGHGVKYENYNSTDDGYGRLNDGHLNFATGAPHSEDDADYAGGPYLKKGKVTRQDPMSHRIIEKRRRDRMNNCLADLSRLIPPDYLKKGRGRVEKTEIIEMAIRHLKYLQDRANAGGERQNGEVSAENSSGADHFRLGYQECVAELLRYLVQLAGYEAADPLCVQLLAHLHGHCDRIMKGEPLRQDKHNSNNNNNGNSSETTSSSSSSLCYNATPVITQTRSGAAEGNPNELGQAYPPAAPASPLLMDCETLPLDNRKQETLRNIRRPEHADDYLHSYKFKNSIERRFSRSIDEAHDMTMRQGKIYKRRRALIKHTPSTSTSASNDDTCRDTSPPDSSESPPDQTPTQYIPERDLKPKCVPVFALNAQGKYYVPLSVDYACLARYLGPYELLEGRISAGAPLHPVSIYVNFQASQEKLQHHAVKREPPLDREWRPV